MTEVIELAFLLGLWNGDCAGGRLLSTDSGLADLLPLGVLYTSALSSVDYFLVRLYLYMSIIHSDKQRQGLVGLRAMTHTAINCGNIMAQLSCAIILPVCHS